MDMRLHDAYVGPVLMSAARLADFLVKAGSRKIETGHICCIGAYVKEKIIFFSPSFFISVPGQPTPNQNLPLTGIHHNAVGKVQE